MKEVLISIRPEWCELIVIGQKTNELRKTKPKLETPFKCYIYCTKSSKKYQTVAKPMVLNDDELFKLPNGKIKYGNSIELIGYDGYSKDNFLNSKVIGEFICKETTKIAYCGYDNRSIALNIVDDNLKCKKLDKGFLYRCQLSFSDIEKYANGNEVYGWHISDLKLYEEPKELEAFTTFCDANKKHCANCKHYLFDNDDLNGYRRWCDVCHRKPLTRPPQSWCYVEGRKDR